MQYRLIALDLDGTLLSSRKEITPRTREALRAARERGIVTVIATGRTPQSAAHFSRLIGGGPVICCNGAGVLDEQGQFVHCKAIPDAPLLRCLELCRQVKVLVECYTDRHLVLDGPLAHVRVYMGWVRPKMGVARALSSLLHVWHTNRMLPVPSLYKWAQRKGHAPVLKIMIIGRPEQMGPLAEAIQRQAPGLEVTSSGKDNLEVMAAGTSKGSGLAILGARLKIPRDAMIAFGDSDNDLAMLTYAGMGVAMGNAQPNVKQQARRVTATNDEDGIARLIEELCLS